MFAVDAPTPQRLLQGTAHTRASVGDNSKLTRWHLQQHLRPTPLVGTQPNFSHCFLLRKLSWYNSLRIVNSRSSVIPECRSRARRLYRLAGLWVCFSLAVGAGGDSSWVVQTPRQASFSNRLRTCQWRLKQALPKSRLAMFGRRRAPGDRPCTSIPARFGGESGVRWASSTFLGNDKSRLSPRATWTVPLHTLGNAIAAAHSPQFAIRNPAYRSVPLNFRTMDLQSVARDFRRCGGHCRVGIDGPKVRRITRLIVNITAQKWYAEFVASWPQSANYATCLPFHFPLADLHRNAIQNL